METSDDALIDLGILGKDQGIFGKEFWRGKDPKTAAPATQAKTTTKTATALEQESEQKKLNKRRKASLLTKAFGPATVSRPTLGQAGLLGVN